MPCPTCGTTLREGMVFCTQCGTRQPAPSAGGSSVPVPVKRTGDSQRPGIFFMGPTLAKLEGGSLFRRFFSILLYFWGVLLAICGLIGTIGLVDSTFKDHVGGFVAYVVFLPIMLVGLYMLVHLVFLRAKTIINLRKSAYSIVPIYAVLLKLAGETLAVLCLLAGVLGCLSAWFGSSHYGSIFDFPLQGGFLSGLGYLFGCCLGAVNLLVIMYFLSEIMLAIIDIAVSSRETAANTGKANNEQ